MTHPRVSYSLPCTVLEGTQHSLHTFHKGNFLNVISYKRNGEVHMNLRKLIFLYREEIYFKSLFDFSASWTRRTAWTNERVWQVMWFAAVPVILHSPITGPVPLPCTTTNPPLRMHAPFRLPQWLRPIRKQTLPSISSPFPTDNNVNVNPSYRPQLNRRTLYNSYLS